MAANVAVLKQLMLCRQNRETEINPAHTAGCTTPVAIIYGRRCLEWVIQLQQQGESDRG